MKSLTDALPPHPGWNPGAPAPPAVVCDMSRAVAMPTIGGALARAVEAEMAARAGWAPSQVNPGAEPWRNANHDYGHRSTAVVTITASMQAEARRVADAAAAALQPISPAALRSWLTFVNTACEFPLETSPLLARAAANAEILGDTPAAAFTDEARSTLGSTVSRFPSAKHVLDAVRPEAERLAGKLDALRRLAARAPADEPRLVPTPVSPEQKAVDEARSVAMVADLKAGLADHERSARVAGVKGSPVSPLHMMAGYRNTVRAGGPTASAAAARLAHLERDFPDAKDQLDEIEAEAAAAMERRRQHA